MVETLSKNITRQGLTATTLNYLRVSTTNVPGRLEDLPPEEANEPQPSSGVLPAVSTVVGGGTPGPLPSTEQLEPSTLRANQAATAVA